MVTDCTANASLMCTGTRAVLGGCWTMYASAACDGASKRRHSIVGPLLSTTAGRDTPSGMSLWVGEVTLADSVKVPSSANANWACAGDGTDGDDAYSYVMSSTRLPQLSYESTISVT